MFQGSPLVLLQQVEPRLVSHLEHQPQQQLLLPGDSVLGALLPPRQEDCSGHLLPRRPQQWHRNLLPGLLLLRLLQRPPWLPLLLAVLALALWWLRLQILLPLVASLWVGLNQDKHLPLVGLL